MKRLFGTLGTATVLVLLASSSAVAQVVTDPSVVPEKVVVPWLEVVAWGVLGLGVLVGIVCAFRYSRWLAKSAATMEAEDAVLRPTIAPKVLIGAVAPRPPSPAPASVGTVAAPAAAPAPSAAPVAPAPAAAAAPVATANVDLAEAPAAPAAAPEAAPAPVVEEKKVEVEPDQATFDRVLQEQLDKGVDRRVAEGRAKAAAIKAARANAGG